MSILLNVHPNNCYKYYDAIWLRIIRPDIMRPNIIRPGIIDWLGRPCKWLLSIPEEGWLGWIYSETNKTEIGALLIFESSDRHVAATTMEQWWQWIPNEYDPKAELPANISEPLLAKKVKYTAEKKEIHEMNTDKAMLENSFVSVRNTFPRKPFFNDPILNEEWTSGESGENQQITAVKRMQDCVAIAEVLNIGTSYQCFVYFQDSPFKYLL